MPYYEDFLRITWAIWDVIDIYHGTKNFLDTFNQVHPAAAALNAANFCQEEVGNGGFRHFFSIHAGVLAPEAAAGFKLIGQIQVARIVDQAMAIFGQHYIRERDARRKHLKSLREDFFYGLDERFFTLIKTESGGFETAADRYFSQIKVRIDPSAQ
ncbi:MAG: DUF4375 domain-containing protein [Terracidiphilus sp.]|jgi:hypothetical protein